MIDLGKNKKGYCSIQELSEYLLDYLIYEGIYDVENDSWEPDKYLIKQNIFSKTYKITELFACLIYRYIKGLITR